MLPLLLGPRDSTRVAYINLITYVTHLMRACLKAMSVLTLPVCQIHTGMHNPLEEGEPRGMPLDFPTLPEVLQKQNYSTHMVGKWHLGYHRKEYTPLYRGFQSFYGKNKLDILHTRMPVAL